MSAPLLTAWVRCSKRQPSMPGYYDVKYDDDEVAFGVRFYWTGTYWTGQQDTTWRTAFGNSGGNDSWRGLASKPRSEK